MFLVLPLALICLVVSFAMFIGALKEKNTFLILVADYIAYVALLLGACHEFFTGESMWIFFLIYLPGAILWTLKIFMDTEMYKKEEEILEKLIREEVLPQVVVMLNRKKDCKKDDDTNDQH